MVVNRTLKLRFRRRVRRGKRQVEEFGQVAEDRLERDFFRRLDRLIDVRRFIITWLLLCVLLAGCLIVQLYGLTRYYQTLQPAPGGTYTEGILGTFTNASPMYATSAVDTTVSRLIFAGLLKYNDNNKLTGNLAQSWSVDDRGTTYTVHLRPHLTWQDGQPLTADDVVFTFRAIQNPDAQSPLNGGWTGVKVAAVDPLTVTFTLPNVLSSFADSLTTGIVPKHLLASTPMSQLRSSTFNTTHPVGAGPFSLHAIQVNGTNDQNRQEQVELVPFAQYAGGKPKLDSFVVHSFLSETQLNDAFKAQEVNAIVGPSTVAADIAKQPNVMVDSFPLTAAVMSFFKTSQGVLADTQVRQALVKGANVPGIIKDLGYPTLPVTEPILRGQLGFNPLYQQFGFDPNAANAQLTQAGWNPGTDGIRTKDGQRLSFKLYAENNSEYSLVASALQKQWRTIGVDMQVILQSDSDFQTTLTQHTYDALLYGISIGADPDVFVYWDSSQADPRATHRYNFSEYKTAPVDAALEAGRTRLDPTLRSAKYQPFLQTWQADAPALGLYQPRFLYITHGTVFGLDSHSLNTGTDRFDNVQNWMVRQRWTTPQNKHPAP
ncbi:MAG TPA: peptide ABC transporter substrate-binding protein [Candidatus Saccharimonadales bacterium]|nr:peptide ABC transporter substrate-binding protein [Candidatus Saccharimonadales bacterium]